MGDISLSVDIGFKPSGIGVQLLYSWSVDYRGTRRTSFENVFKVSCGGIGEFKL